MKNSRKNQVIKQVISGVTDITRKSLVSRIKTENGITSGTWNHKRVIHIESNIWEVAE